MTRKEMLDILHKTEFNYIWPPSEWEDIGFTEQDIWVNSSGYGYVMCDEHTGWDECDGVSEEKWFDIIEKIKAETLMISDVEGTPLGAVLEDWLYDLKGTDDESREVSSVYSGLIDIAQEVPKHIWWMEDSIEKYPLTFFTTEESFNKAYERDDCDYSWDELEDDMLEEWIKRISECE